MKRCVIDSHGNVFFVPASLLEGRVVCSVVEDETASQVQGQSGLSALFSDTSDDVSESDRSESTGFFESLRSSGSADSEQVLRPYRESYSAIQELVIARIGSSSAD